MSKYELKNLENESIIAWLNKYQAETPEYIVKERKEYKRRKTLVLGKDTPEYLDKIEGYENNEQFKLRKKFSGTSRHQYHNTLNPVDKVFSASGGSEEILSLNTTQEQELNGYLLNVSEGQSSKNYIKNVFRDHYYVDPMGLLYFSWDEEDLYLSQKSIETIRYYESDGRHVKYVFFEPRDIKNEQGELLYKEWHYIDSEKDITIKDVEGTFTIIEEFENPFGYVPAIINSEIFALEDNVRESCVDTIVDLGDKFLRGQSTRNIFEQLHMYPIFWMYAQKCGDCNGTGEVERNIDYQGGNFETTGTTCSSCNGSGQSMKKDVSDALILATPKDKDSPTIAPNVAGYEAPELDTYKESRYELEWVSRLMDFTMWGTTKASYDATGEKTATQVYVDTQPQHDRLGGFTDSFEYVDKFITDIFGAYYFPETYDKDKTTVSWGRRYLIESPDAVLESYLKTLTPNIPDPIKNHKLKVYYQTVYSTDNISKQKALLSIQVEPFIHYSIEQVFKMNVGSKDYYDKVYFNEFWKGLNIKGQKPERLKQLLREYSEQRVLEGGETEQAEEQPPKE